MAMQKNLYGMAMIAKMKERAYEDGIPIHATFELTPRCGFNCRMCYVHLPVDKIQEVGRGRELTGEEWLEIGRQAAEMGVLSICITGGDPVLHPEFERIWIGLSKMGFRLILQTNASQLSGHLLEVLEEYPPDTVKITLYGSNDEVYREVCKVEEGFTRTDRGIKALRERGFAIQLVTTFIKQNREDAARIVAYARANSLPWYYSASCYPSLRGAKSEARECALDVWSLGCEQDMAELWSKLPPEKDETLPGQKCSGYRTEFNITWDGYMRFCLFLDEPNISVVGEELDLQQCWEELLSYWGGLRWPKECYECEVREKCKRCLAHLACLNGGVGKLDGSYCEKIRKMIEISKEEKR